MIPQNLAAWLEGGPWLINRDHFFHHASDVLVGKKARPEPFTIQNGRQGYDGSYEDRSVHEIAHLICCKDDQIFDPYWGFQEFNFDDGTKEGTRLSLECSKKEIEVVVIDVIIDNHIRNQTPTHRLLPRFFAVLCKNGNTVPEGITEDMFIIREADKALQKWNLKTIWAELQRKYALVAKELS